MCKHCMKTTAVLLVAHPPGIAAGDIATPRETLLVQVADHFWVAQRPLTELPGVLHGK